MCVLTLLPGPALRRASCLVYGLSVIVLKFLIFKQGALHFHFALGPTDYLAHSSENESYCIKIKR